MVGLSTMSYLMHKSMLPSRNFLLVQPGFETKLLADANNSFAAKSKYESFNILKNLGLVGTIKDLNDPFLKFDFLTTLNGEAHFNIVGLGGRSGDVLLKMNDFWCRKKNVSFCIMPFTFEGSKRTNKAKLQLSFVKKMMGECIPLHNQELFKGIGKKSTFEDAFQIFHNIIESRILKE